MKRNYLQQTALIGGSIFLWTLVFCTRLLVTTGKIKLMRVTAYCPCEKCCGEYADGVTASGYVIQPGDRFCAADSNVPFDTMIHIPGYNDGKPVPVLDRGSAIGPGQLDVYFDTHEQALQWGIQFLYVEIQ